MTKDKTNIRQGKRPFLPPQGDDNSKPEATCQSSCATTTDSTKTASSTNAKSSFPVKQGEKSVPEGVGKDLESTLDGRNDRPSKKRKNMDKKSGRTGHISSRASASSASTVPVFHEPCEKDVLLGRGKQCQQHEGNQRMLMIIGKHHKAYISEKREKRKPMANSVLDEILKGGVRFLKNTADEDEEDERWEEVGREVALDKVSHALRCKTRKYQRVGQEEQKEKEARRAKTASVSPSTGALPTQPRAINSTTPSHIHMMDPNLINAMQMLQQQSTIPLPVSAFLGFNASLPLVPGVTLPLSNPGTLNPLPQTLNDRVSFGSFSVGANASSGPTTSSHPLDSVPSLSGARAEVSGGRMDTTNIQETTQPTPLHGLAATFNAGIVPGLAGSRVVTATNPFVSNSQLPHQLYGISNLSGLRDANGGLSSAANGTNNADFTVFQQMYLDGLLRRQG